MHRSVPLSLAIALAAPAIVQAASIGIDFGVSGMTIADTQAPALPVAGAPGYVQGNWNIATGNSNNTVGISLIDDSGAAAGHLRWTSDGGTQPPTGLSTGDRALFSSSLWADLAKPSSGASSTADAIHITVTNLPASFVSSGYKLIVYYDASSAAVNSGAMNAAVDYGNDGSVEVNQPYYNSSAIFDGTYIEYNPADPTGNSNFVQIISDNSIGQSSFKLALSAVSTDESQRAVITGLQIVQVPEPAALGLVGLGGLASLRRRRVH